MLTMSLLLLAPTRETACRKPVERGDVIAVALTRGGSFRLVPAKNGTVMTPLPIMRAQIHSFPPWERLQILHFWSQEDQLGQEIANVKKCITEIIDKLRAAALEHSFESMEKELLKSASTAYVGQTFI